MYNFWETQQEPEGEDHLSIEREDSMHPYYQIGAEDLGGPYEIAGRSNVERLLSAVAGDEFVGAAYPVMARPPMGMSVPQLRAMYPTGHLVQQQQRTKSRQYTLGFDSGAGVNAGAQAQITTRPQVLFRGERLIVPSDIAGVFTVDDIKIGKNSQLAAAGSIPARVYQEDGVGVRLMLDTCQVAMDVTLLATNVGGAPTRFRAALIGSAIE